MPKKERTYAESIGAMEEAALSLRGWEFAWLAGRFHRPAVPLPRREKCFFVAGSDAFQNARLFLDPVSVLAQNKPSPLPRCHIPHLLIRLPRDARAWQSGAWKEGPHPPVGIFHRGPGTSLCEIYTPFARVRASQAQLRD